VAVAQEEPVQEEVEKEVAVVDPEKQSDVSDSEDLGEVSADVNAESLISNDLDSEEEVQEPSPIASKFWSFLLPSRTPSPVKTPDKRPSLTSMVL